jgi:hypothetical protein
MEVSMITKDLIQVEVDSIDDEYLDELYDLIRRFTQEKQRGVKPTFMAKLKSVQIDAPEDFAANLDLYVSGEKRVEPDLC